MAKLFSTGIETEMKEMQFKVLCLILITVSSVACQSSPKMNDTQSVPTAILASRTKVSSFPTPPSTVISTLSPTPTLTLTLTATPAQAACPPFAVDTAPPVPDDPQNYIGLHFDTLPAGLTSPDGSMLDGPDTYYIVSEVVRESGAMLWLERNLCHDENGHAYYEIRSALALPTLQPQEKLIIGTCRLKEAAAAEGEATSSEEEDVSTFYDPAIVVVGWFDDIYEPPVRLDYAWRANPQTESFEVLPPESVTCADLQWFQ